MEGKLLPYEDRNFWAVDEKPTKYDCPLCNYGISRKEVFTSMAYVKAKNPKRIKGNRRQRSIFKFLDRGRWKIFVTNYSNFKN